MDNTEDMLRKRFEELSRNAYSQGTYYFSDFLSLADAAVLYRYIDSREFTVWGGCEGCERVMARFGNSEEFGYEQNFPIVAICVEPVMEKFADELNHRDFLGALMNLGIERDVIGDIRVCGKTAVIFAEDTMAEYLVDNLHQVKHTNVRCMVMEPAQVGALAQYQTEELELLVPSERVDAIVAKMYHLSRNAAADLFQAKKIYINGRQSESGSSTLAAGDIISVRGYGKFAYDGIQRMTKKDKLCVRIQKYI